MPHIPSLTWAFEQTELGLHKGVIHWIPEENKKTRTWETHIRPISIICAFDQSSHVLKKSDKTFFFPVLWSKFFFCLKEMRMKFALSCLLKVKRLISLPLAAPKRIATIMNEWTKTGVTVWTNSRVESLKQTDCSSVWCHKEGRKRHFGPKYT